MNINKLKICVIDSLQRAEDYIITNSKKVNLSSVLQLVNYNIFCGSFKKSFNIIEYFENNQSLQKKGSTAKGVEESRKKSTDITISPNKLSDPKYKVFQNYI